MGLPSLTENGLWRRTDDGLIERGCCGCECTLEYLHLAFSNINLSDCNYVTGCGGPPCCPCCHYNDVTGGVNLSVVIPKRTGGALPGQLPFCYWGNTLSTGRYACSSSPPGTIGTVPYVTLQAAVIAWPAYTSTAYVLLSRGPVAPGSCVSPPNHPGGGFGGGGQYYFYRQFSSTEEEFCTRRTFSNSLPNSACGQTSSPFWRGLGYGGTVTITPL